MLLLQYLLKEIAKMIMVTQGHVTDIVIILVEMVAKPTAACLHLVFCCSDITLLNSVAKHLLKQGPVTECALLVTRTRVIVV